MKRILIGIVIALGVILAFRSCWEDRQEKSILKENSMLLQQQVQNVSKLIVTEGHFSEVYTYKDSQQLFGPLLSAQKKALVVVNAEVIIAYDLAQVEFRVDEATKTLHIEHIPDPEIRVNPDFEYYDVTADYLNPFRADDYNTIKKNVKASLMKKIEASSLKRNAQDRLISELSKFLVLTRSMGWTLVYENRPITEGFEGLLPEIKG